MSNASKIIEEIGNFLDKFSLKTNKLTHEDLINFIEKKWQEADDEKYTIRQGYIYIARMTNEYIWKKDFENMMRWLSMDDLHSSAQKNASYIRNYYKGQCCLDCGNEEKALEFFYLSYNENPEYIYTRAPFCYEFFNQHLENPKELPKRKTEKKTVKSIELKEWQLFFNEKPKKIRYEILKNDFEYVKQANKKHKNGLEYLQNNQMQILESMLTGLLEKYPDLQKLYDYPEEDKPYFMPDIKGIKGFATLLSPLSFFITSVYKDDIPYIGFSFSCSWDSEHGLGVMTHKDRVIKIDGAEMAFAIWAAKDDLKENKQK